MRNLFALLGLARYALARVYMSRSERRRVRGRAREVSFATVLPAAWYFVASLAVSLASDIRVLGILCALGARNLLHDAIAAVAGKRSQS